ncbi:hypothetical protein X798_04338 [Onchocerca flexuosa]|uniref:Uncharacterized protein n=1 Tax=Onchocerca flexuosa TaxID=387005 RepID=A0A238BTI8_9BILA|nr:hypothetical protein X798_04338 [Onchocerca flexuosa]
MARPNSHGVGSIYRDIANKMATRRSADYSNEYGTRGWTPRPSELSQAAWLTSGVTKPAVCSSPPRKTVGWTHYREPAPD